MIIPLGLGQRLKKTPVLTILIVFVTCLFFSLQQKSNYTIFSIAKMRKKYNLKRHSVTLFRNYCYQRTGYKRLCKKYSSLIADKYFEIPNDFDEKNLKLIESFKKSYMKRQKKRRRLIKELSLAIKGQKRYKVLAVVNDFLRHRFKPHKELRRTRGYKAYRRSLRTFYRDIRAIHKAQNSLSKLNFKGVPVVMAQLSHGDYFHLISNMFLFVVLGVFLEQRLSLLAYLCIYLLGGSFAVAAHTALAADPTIPLVGASGNVSAVLGAFWVFFFNFSMRLFVPPAFKERIFLPVKLTVPFLFLMGDAVGYLLSQNPLMDGSRVGHMAHLSGFFMGAFIALIIKLFFNNLSWPFIAPVEVKELKDLEKLTNLDDKLAKSNAMLATNRDNIFVMTSTITSICASMQDEDSKRKVLENSNYKKFIEHGLKVICTLGIRFGKESMVCHFLNSIPVQVPLHVKLTELGQDNMLYLADCALFFGYPVLSLRLYESYLYQYQGAKQAPLVSMSIRSLLSMLPKNEEWIEVISILKDQSMTTSFALELDEYLGLKPAETA